MEIDVDGVPWKDDIINEHPTIKDGFLMIPDRPGLGADLNEKEIAKHLWPN
jgi:L-alanine-DL-glutamate epimerase-like enolase superfamily enzyme